MEIRGIVTTTVLILALITISTTTAAAIDCDCGDICVNETGWWRDGGALNASTTPIQAAVDNATAGETICVAAGNYSENVDIATAHLTLEGEGAGLVTVTAKNPDDHVFYVTADYVNISGFTVTRATSYAYAGIYLSSANHCNIFENTASSNYYGIWLSSSSSNMLMGNTANSNGNDGIRLSSSSNNTLTSNTANSNNYYGICLVVSSNNTLTSNTMSGNTYNFYAYGHSLSKYTQNIDTSNMVDGKPIYYWVDQKDKQIPSNAGFVGVVNGTNITIRDLTLTNNSDGVLFAYTKNSRIENVTASSNYEGIRLDFSSNNTLTSNNCSNNNYGIYLGWSKNNTLTNNTISNSKYGIVLESNDNLIYNNYFNNTKNAYDYGSNQWNTTKTSGTNIIGGPYLGGNYWGDYAGNDTDWDCLGDTQLPYNSSGNIWNGGDYHPLVVPTDTTPPVITITTPVPYELYTVGMELNFSATDSESGVATIVGNLTNTSGVSQIVDSGFAPAVGVYTLVVTATDNASNTNESDPVFFVVYDSDSGHAIGSGWFYLDGDSTLPDGRAKFGFTARYKDNNSTGKLSFQCNDADIDLKSMSLDWMTVSSVSAQFQGTGTINDEGLYTFRVEVNDNGEPGVGVDHFDIKIWNGTDTEANPYHKAKNIISGGNIQI